MRTSFVLQIVESLGRGWLQEIIDSCRRKGSRLYLMVVGLRRFFEREISRMWWFDKSKELGSWLLQQMLLICLWFVFEFICGGGVLRILIIFYFKCWLFEFFQRSICLVLSEFFFLVQSSLEVLAMMLVSEVFQGYFLINKGLELENKCSVFFYFCGIILRYIIYVFLEYFQGVEYQQ